MRVSEVEVDLCFGDQASRRETALGWWGPGRGRVLAVLVGAGAGMLPPAGSAPPRFHCVFILFLELELATLQPLARKSLERCKIQWFWQLFGSRPFPGPWTAPEPHSLLNPKHETLNPKP